MAFSRAVVEGDGDGLASSLVEVHHIELRFGMYCRMRPFVFSFVPRSPRMIGSREIEPDVRGAFDIAVAACLQL